MVAVLRRPAFDPRQLRRDADEGSPDGFVAEHLYAVGPSDQVLLIERGPDGFWGWWRATGTSAKRIAHGGSVIASIGLDDRLSALQRYPADSWFTWDRMATEVCATHIPGRGPVIFAADE